METSKSFKSPLRKQDQNPETKEKWKKEGEKSESVGLVKFH